ncbi:flagellar hook-length control protein FliK, partial [Siccirubricoccus sp. KC 17139]
APSPAGPPAEASLAAAPRSAPPPVRQVAPVAVALALAPGQSNRLVVALEPGSLGRVEISIERDAAGEVAAVKVRAERPETLALLQRDAREFDRSLTQAGVQVPDGGMSFSLSDSGGRAAGQGGGQEGGRPGARGAAAPASPPAAESAPPGLAYALLDIAV